MTVMWRGLFKIRDQDKRATIRSVLQLELCGARATNGILSLPRFLCTGCLGLVNVSLVHQSERFTGFVQLGEDVNGAARLFIGS